MIGAGSMSLGVERAGFEIADVFENPGFSKNATGWDLNREPHVRLEEEEPFPGGDYHPYLVYGNPPCGGLSMMRNSKIDAYKRTNEIMIGWLDAAISARPQMILMENAPGLSSQMGTYWRERLLGKLAASGYHGWVWRFRSWQVGTPQHRPRTFLCGSRVPVDERWKRTDDLPKRAPYPHYETPASLLASTLSVEPTPEDTVDALGRPLTAHWWDKAGEVVMERVALYGDRWFGGNYISPPLLARYEARAAAGDEGAKKMVEVMKDKLWPECPRSLHYPMSFGLPSPLKFELPYSTVITTPTLMVRKPSDGSWRVLTMREAASFMGFPRDWKLPKPYKMHHLAQGVPANNTCWAASRLLAAVQGERPPKQEGELDQLALSV